MKSRQAKRQVAALWRLRSELRKQYSTQRWRGRQLKNEEVSKLVVNDKALVREMKEAYKGWGYTVMVMDGDKWVIQSLNGWAVEIEGQVNVPNEVLALIVLHMGYLPKPKRCYRIYKGDKCTCV